MADVIVLSDDSDPGTRRHARKHSSKSERTKDRTVKQWNNIFSQKSHRDRRDRNVQPGRSSHRSSDHSSKRSPEKSSRHSSHRPSERHSQHHSSSRQDKERYRREHSSSRKTIIELDISDDEMKSPSKNSRDKSTSVTGSKDSSRDRESKKGSQHRSESSSRHRSENGSRHRHSEKSSRDHSRSSSHHSSKPPSNHYPSTSKKPSENSSATTVIEISSGKSTLQKIVSEKRASEKTPEKSTSDISPNVTENGRRHSGSRRSLAEELGVSRADCRRDDEPSPMIDRHVNGQHAKPAAEPPSQARSSQCKRPADDGEQAAPKRVRLTTVKLVRLEDMSDKSAAEGKKKPELKPEPKPEPCPCQQSLEEVCTLLKPLLSGPEVKLEGKVRRRHAAVLALAGGRSGRKQHLTGVTEQCAARLRAEPERCFTVLRGFLEQLDQIKIVASSAQSRTGPAPATAVVGKAAAGAEKEKTATSAGVEKAAKASKAPSATEAVKTPPMVNGSGPSTAPSEQDAKEARRHRRHVAKLEKTLRRLEREIIRQDEQEVDWADAAGSAYIVAARLKRRYVQVYRYYCRLVGAGEEAQRLDSRRIRFDGTRYPAINRRIEKFVNQTREFPDFKDVLSLIETANRRDRLQLRPGALRDQAKEAFLQLGALLQKRRRAALAESMDSLAGAEEWRSRDPAAGDPSLGGKLAENAASGKERLNEVFRDFVQRQEVAAAERREKRAEDGAAEDDEEEEDEEDEEAEESEVTDEELEQQMPAMPTGGETPMSDASEQGGSPSDVEMAEAGDGEVKENGGADGERSEGEAKSAEGSKERSAVDGNVKENGNVDGESGEAGASDAKTGEGGASDVETAEVKSRNVESPGALAGGNDAKPASSSAQVSGDDAIANVQGDRDAAERKESDSSKAAADDKKCENDAEPRDEPGCADVSMEKDTPAGVPMKSSDTVDCEPQQGAVSDVSAQNEEIKSGPVEKECEKGGNNVSAAE